jgi:hypothetical protein
MKRHALQVVGAETLPSCSAHAGFPAQPFAAFCKVHQKLICMHCFLVEHQACERLAIAGVASSLRAELLALIVPQQLLQSNVVAAAQISQVEAALAETSGCSVSVTLCGAPLGGSLFRVPLLRWEYYHPGVFEQFFDRYEWTCCRHMRNQVVGAGIVVTHADRYSDGSPLYGCQRKVF